MQRRPFDQITVKQYLSPVVSVSVLCSTSVPFPLFQLQAGQRRSICLSLTLFHSTMTICISVSLSITLYLSLSSVYMYKRSNILYKITNKALKQKKSTFGCYAVQSTRKKSKAKANQSTNQSPPLSLFRSP